MTKREVSKKMQVAGIVGQLTGRGEAWEVELADEATMDFFLAAMPSEDLGGFKTGYGSWVLRPGYRSLGDWSDRTSRWHY